MIEKRNVSLNLNIRGIGQSATLAIQRQVRTMRAAGHHVFNLGLGQSPFPVPAPLVDGLREHASRNEYAPVEGLPELRRAVADWHRRREGIETHEDLVLVGPGSKELLFLLQMTFYGEIIVPTPCWVSYTPQANIIGRRVRLVHTSFDDGWKLSPELLERSFESDHDRYRPRLFVLNYPGNPTGVTYSDAELAEIARVCRDYEVLILSDEIYSGLHFGGTHTSVARHYPEGTIIANGISKWASAGGWRLGVFTFPHELSWLHEAMASVASETYTSVSTPIQHAAIRAFQQSRRMELSLFHMRRILSTLALYAHGRLSDAGMAVARPEGAFYLFPDMSGKRDVLAARGVTDSATLCRTLLDEVGVAALPGSAFERPPNELTCRLSLVDFDGARALTRSESVPMDEALPQRFIEETCPSIHEAIEALASWYAAL